MKSLCDAAQDLDSRYDLLQQGEAVLGNFAMQERDGMAHPREVIIDDFSNVESHSSI